MPLMTELAGGIHIAQRTAINAEISCAIAEKVMDSVSTLREDLLNQMLGGMGVGGNFNTAA